MIQEATAIASIQPKSEYYDACKQALLELQKPTLKELGCLQFDIFESENNNGKIYLFERFENEESRNLHLTYDYTKKVIAAYNDWLAEDIQVVIMMDGSVR